MTDAAIHVRSYRPLDHRECRALWAELAEVDRKVLGDPGIGGADPGAAFEEYLTRLDLAGIWVAESQDQGQDQGVVGLVGLVLGGGAAPGLASGAAVRGMSGVVEPIIVADRVRGRGVGHALLEHVAAQARHRAMRRLSVSPSPRNAEALRSLHEAGYDQLSALTLTLNLGPDTGQAVERLDVDGLSFRY
jgi:GNAT superfamily N-acetyltransferase